MGLAEGEFLHSVNVIYIDPSLKTRNEYHLVVVYNPFNVLLNLFCQYFVEDFCSSVYREIGPFFHEHL